MDRSKNVITKAVLSLQLLRNSSRNTKRATVMIAHTNARFVARDSIIDPD